ncbi:hypothetical protein KR009_010142 [Drosophila setifemur]|nr:hypothetical protein KR009_010142 [Drosophila setifemur]
MGVQSYVKEKVQRIGKSQVTSDEKSMKPPGPPPTPNLGEDVRLLVNSSPFDNTFTTAAPFLCASVGAWSGYWVFRGLDYHSHRAHIPLPIYIRQTFYQAKLVQFLIILAGTFTVLRKNRRMRWMPTLDVGK